MYFSSALSPVRIYMSPFIVILLSFYDKLIIVNLKDTNSERVLISEYSVNPVSV